MCAASPRCAELARAVTGPSAWASPCCGACGASDGTDPRDRVRRGPTLARAWQSYDPRPGRVTFGDNVRRLRALHALHLQSRSTYSGRQQRDPWRRQVRLRRWGSASATSASSPSRVFGYRPSQYPRRSPSGLAPIRMLPVTIERNAWIGRRLPYFRRRRGGELGGGSRRRVHALGSPEHDRGRQSRKGCGPDPISRRHAVIPEATDSRTGQ